MHLPAVVVDTEGVVVVVAVVAVSFLSSVFGSSVVAVDAAASELCVNEIKQIDHHWLAWQVKNYTDFRLP